MVDTSVSRSRTSQELLERAQGSLVGGVSSPFRAKHPRPLYFADSVGSKLLDVDGNWYIDYTLAWGPNILGHKWPSLSLAVQQAASGAFTYGAQHQLEFQVAEKIQQAVPCAGLVAYSSSGSEAVQLAWRLARAATGRTRILKFEGHYHGWMDSALISYKPSESAVGDPAAPNAVPGSAGQVPAALDSVAIARWNSIESVEAAFSRHPGEIAAVMMEPVLCNSGCILPQDGFLDAVANVARSHGALLIFDEVITGFRMSLGGAQGFYGITPDLATFGKAMAGGAPLSAVAGRRDLMSLMLTGGVAFGGTFNGNPIVMAAANATLDALAANQGAILNQANELGRELMAGIQNAAQRHRVPLQVYGFGCAFSLHFRTGDPPAEYRDLFRNDAEALKRCVLALLDEGISILPDGRLYTSCAHDARDASDTIDAFARVFARW
ncbi:MAG: aspartate aminotransferase family protein [Acidobacteria bacterium]|nr:aspartate aminotransferase family protein [Acidobacteriota bacterium]